MNPCKQSIIRHAQIISEITKVLERHPIIDSSDDNEEEELRGEANLNELTAETTSTKSNTVLSTPSAIKGETFNPSKKVMSGPQA